MENLQLEYKIAQLIALEISGEISEEDLHFLENWKAQSPENERLYTAIKEGSRLKRRNQFVNTLNTKENWKGVQTKIHFKRKQFRLKAWSFRVAVVLILGLLLGSLYQQSNNKPILEESRQLSQLQNQVQIQPGSAKAVLHLHNGKTIDLEDEDEKPHSIVEKDGTLINYQKGQLSYATAKDSEPQVLYNRIKVPRGGKYQLTLSDGTLVWLNSDSEIKYPVQFRENERKVQVAGEVYFDVAHNKKKPFVVDVKELEIEVLGTEFNVEAYRENSSVVTTLVKGSVRLRKDKQSLVMKANQQAEIAKNKNVFTVKNVEARKVALWKDGVFYFREASLETIMKKLERWYNVKVLFHNQSDKTQRFSLEIEKSENIEKILHVLTKTKKVNFDIHANVITVKNGIREKSRV